MSHDNTGQTGSPLRGSEINIKKINSGDDERKEDVYEAQNEMVDKEGSDQ